MATDQFSGFDTTTKLLASNDQTGVDPFSLEYAEQQGAATSSKSNNKLKGHAEVEAQSVEQTAGSADKATKTFNLQVQYDDHSQVFVPEVGLMDVVKNPEPPQTFTPTGWSYEALPPRDLQSETVQGAYKGKESAKYNRGIHNIGVTIDMNGNHFADDGDPYQAYDLRWSIPTSYTHDKKLTGPICLENDNGEQLPTKDWYSVQVSHDEGNIRADGFIMHYDEKTSNWFRFNKLMFLFDTPESIGPQYGLHPKTSAYDYCSPALEYPPQVIADVLRPAKRESDK